MNRPVKLWEAILGLIGVLLSVAVMVYDRGKMDGKNATEIQTLKDELRVYQENQDKMDGKIDKMNTDMNNQFTTILIKLEDKQNRK